jgi:hypothetical protein
MKLTAAIITLTALWLLGLLTLQSAIGFPPPDAEITVR